MTPSGRTTRTVSDRGSWPVERDLTELGEVRPDTLVNVDERIRFGQTGPRQSGTALDGP